MTTLLTEFQPKKLALMWLMTVMAAPGFAQVVPYPDGTIPMTVGFFNGTASRSKCGFDTFTTTTPPQKYLTKTVVETASTFTYPTMSAPPNGKYWAAEKAACAGTVSFNSSAGWTMDPVPATCKYYKDAVGVNETQLATGSWNGATNGPGSDSGIGPFSIDALYYPGIELGVPNGTASGYAVFTPGTVGNSTTNYNEDTCAITSSGATPVLQGLLATSPSSPTAWVQTTDESQYTPGTRTTSLATEYTSSTLHSKVTSDLSSAAWSQNDAIKSSYKSWNSDQTSVSARKLKFFFRVKTEERVIYIATWQVWSTSSAGGAPTLAEYKYEFRGTGSTMDKTNEIAVPNPPFGSSATNTVMNVQVRKKTCDDCKGTACAALANQGVKMDLPLGKGDFGEHAGNLWIHERMPGTSLSTPAALQFAGDPNLAEVINDANGIRQTKSAELLVNVLTNGAYDYRIEFFAGTNIGSFSGGLYGTNGPAYLTFAITNPDGASASNRLQVLEKRPGRVLTNLYVWTDATRTWEMTRGNGLRKDIHSVFWTNNNTNRYETNEVRDGVSNALVERSVKKFVVYGWGEGLAEEVNDPGGLALTNTYTYNASGRITRFDRADGSWETFSYNSDGTVAQWNRTFENTEPNDGITAFYSTAHAYGTNAVPGAGDDGTIEPTTPRAIPEALGQSYYQRRWNVFLPGERRQYQATESTATAWNATSNLVTITKYFTNGAFSGLIKSIKHPDATMVLSEYATNSAGTLRTNTLWAGAPAADELSITNGTKSVTVVGLAGQLHSRLVYDVVSGLLIESESYTYDEENRPTAVTFLDGTSVGTLYDCCGVGAVTNREGSVVTFEYDDLKRKFVERAYVTPTASINTYFTYNAAGAVRTVTREGTNGNQIVVQRMGYDAAGRMIAETNATGVVTTYAYSVPDSSGYYSNTITYASGTSVAATRIERYYREGTLDRITGTAVHPKRFNTQGAGDKRMEEFVLDGTGADTVQKTTTYVDQAGRVYKHISQHIGNSYTRLFYFNSKGQLWKEEAPDNAITLYTNNTRGELEYRVLDFDLDNGIDWAGTDRISQSVLDVLTSHGTTVRRLRQYAWITNSVDAATLMRTIEISADGLHRWDNVLGQTSETAIVLAGNGIVWTTNIAPDGSYVVSQQQHGRHISTTEYSPSGSQLSATTCGYDGHRRKTSETDARNGTTTFAYDDLDRVTSVTTPSPGGGGSAQTTTSHYDELGRVWKIVLPDGGAVTNEYYLTGELKKTYGTGIYPVEYIYDTAGKITTNTTWQNFSSAAGAAVTRWRYDPYSGFLTNKYYDDMTGPNYTYHTLAPLGDAHLKKITWARGNSATYAYNNAGEVLTIIYAGTPSTPNVTNTYDRLGRIATVAQGPMTTTFSYNELGQLTGETYSGGDLGNLSISNRYDSLFRRTNNMSLRSGTTLSTAAYSYDTSSRLDTVSDGTHSATYAYHANSPLVSSITFKESGTTRLTTSKAYDFVNRLTSISSSNATLGTFNSHVYVYNDGNQRTRVNLADGSYWLYDYDNKGQITSGKKYWSDGTAVAGQQFAYTFDDIGNRTMTADGGDEYGANLRYANSIPNLLNQVTNRVVSSFVNVIGTATNSSTVTVNNQRTYRRGDYFRGEIFATNSAAPAWMGLTNIAVVTGGAEDIVTNKTGNVFVPKTPEVFKYDADGNLTNDGRWSYVWDAENRLITMTANTNVPTPARLKLDFMYDFRNRRMSKKVSTWNGSSYVLAYTNKFLYDGWNLIAELNQTNGVVRTFLWGTDLSGEIQDAGGVGGLLTVTVTTNGTHFPAYDGNGNISALVSASAETQTAAYEFGPFGEVIRAEGTGANSCPVRFSTKYQDPETDLLYFGERYYCAATGRWLSRDPIDEQGGLNVYAFVQNDPISGVDVLGMWSFGDTKEQFETFRDSLAATSKGFLGTDFGRNYDKCDKALQWSERLGRLSRIPALIAATAGVSAWAAGGTTLLHTGTGVALEGYLAYESTKAVVSGATHLAQGNKWGAVEAGLGLVGLRFGAASLSGAFGRFAQSVQGSRISSLVNRGVNSSGQGVSMVTALAQAFGRPFQSTKNVSQHLAALEQLAASRRIPLQYGASVSSVNEIGGRLRVTIRSNPKNSEVLEETQHLNNVFRRGFPHTRESRLAEELAVKQWLSTHPHLNAVDRLILRLQMRDIRAGRY
jgi:RHS repeat-associated protein